MHSVAPKVRVIVKTWACTLAVLGFAAPACVAQGKSSPDISELMSLIVIVLLFVALALAHWRMRRVAVHARQGALTTGQRIEDLEREKAELLRVQEEMRDFAEHDGLTGLWNHRIIQQRLRQEVDRSSREGAPLSVIMVDLDRFKNVNDTFGHPAGDLVLKEIGGIFQHSMRSYDWVGRYGGEEFLLILPGSNFVSARKRAEQLRIAVKTARVPYGETSIQVTASFGVASGFPADGASMIQTADAALYRAKENGRDCVMATEIAPPESAPTWVRGK
jgi:diguanylate cyclase